MMNLTLNEYNAILRQDFCAFIERSFYELNPNTNYLHNWHIEAIAEALEKCRTGNLQRLIINVPPRSLKSHMTSISFVAWLLGHDPTAQIICASYAQDLADKLAGDCRSVMNARWYRDLFPATRLTGARQAVHDFSTTQRGFRLATSVGGVMTGRGSSYIIIDDPLKPEEALSETQRQTVNSWFDHTLISRLNDKRDGRIILIMQRLHEDDLVGHLVHQTGWHMLKFPAIAEEDEIHVVQTQYGRKVFGRRQGDALHPPREPLEVLASIREMQGEYNFAGQYQQSPAPLGGGMIKQAWFKTYNTNELPTKFDLVLQSWDTANKPTELADYSVCTTWGVKDKHIYLLHVLRKRLDYPFLKRAVVEQAYAFRPTELLIEDRASGTQLIQELIHDGIYAVKRYEPTMEKVIRLHTVTNMIENGFVYLPEKADWLGEFIHELTSFPNGKFDDQTDSTSQALDWLKKRYMGDDLGLLEFWRKWADKQGFSLPQSAAEVKTVQTTRPFNQRTPPVTFNPAAPGPCPKCDFTGVVFCSSQLHCNSCGYTWWPNGNAPEVARVTRADFLAGSVGDAGILELRRPEQMEMSLPIWCCRWLTKCCVTSTARRRARGRKAASRAW